MVLISIIFMGCCAVSSEAMENSNSETNENEDNFVAHPDPNDILSTNTSKIVLKRDELEPYWNKIDSWGKYLTPCEVWNDTEMKNAQDEIIINSSQSGLIIANRGLGSQYPLKLEISVKKFNNLSDAKTVYDDTTNTIKNKYWENRTFQNQIGNEYVGAEGGPPTGPGYNKFVIIFRRNNYVVRLLMMGDVRPNEMYDYATLMDNRIN